MEKNERKTARRKLADNFLKAITEEPLTWRQGFVSAATPQNGKSGRAYTGLNHFILSFAMQEKGWEDPRFFTGSYIFGSEENRNKDKDDPTKLIVKKGEKATAVEAHIYIPKERESQLSVIGPAQYWRLEPEERDKYMPRVRDIPVFNAEQCENVPPMILKHQLQITDNQTREYIDTAIDNMGVKTLERDEYDVPCYIPPLDEIRMPPARFFKSEHEYFTTKLHETCHATGHISRLDRLTLHNEEAYAKEELRVEIATCFIASELNLDMENPSYAKNHTAYIQNWASEIKDNLNALTSAIYDAEGIADYVLDKAGFEKEQSKNAEKEETMRFEKKESIDIAHMQKESVKEKEAKAL